ncbi:HAD hydrolase-like protein [Pedobacter sp. SYP-B3415]|uniref:HAD hydrolase-like protein n=1 Tax=Pedobacter sp. SYP-B3415 TaxID=2496641 RepID=UPI00101B6FF0|nr:HAD hydrolase-like protein [Pedobacter sp. SYP-B3415]
MAYEHLIRHKNAFIFEFDDVLYPERDYLLQVYYLFAQFMEYTEQLPAADMVAFMKKRFEAHGPADIFAETASCFGIGAHFRENFDRLHRSAKLPLKLLLFKDLLVLLQELVVERKKIWIVTPKDPEQQLNKIRQIEWHGLEKYLEVYFCEELNKTPESVYTELIENSGISAENILLVAGNNFQPAASFPPNLPYIRVKDLL